MPGWRATSFASPESTSTHPVILSIWVLDSGTPIPVDPGSPIFASLVLLFHLHFF